MYTLEQCWGVGLRSPYRRCRFWQKKKIIFSDEAQFDLRGYVNKQNCRIWGTENPHAYIEKQTHPKRVTVWCGFCFRGIIGPFFFENEPGEDVTVNGDRYRAMLNECLFTNICFNNKKAPHATQPKQYSMFWALFLKIALSGEAHFDLGGYVNKQN